MARDYAKEYREYHSKPEQRANRSSRNKARRLAIKMHGKEAVKGKDVDHKDGNPRNNSRRNLQITSKSYNRSKK